MTQLPLALAAGLLALQSAAPQTPSLPPAAIIDKAPCSAWVQIAAEELLVMELADGARIVIALAPDFAPAHVANVRALAKARWWDGTAVTRVQDNYVVQWGGAAANKPLPPGIAATPPADYERPRAGVTMRAMAGRDAYAPTVGHAGFWPVAADGDAAWLTHCYGMVGVGRDAAPDTGSGAELYAVIGHAPRHLDRNVALVGRVVEGMERLAALPRGSGALGVYAAAADYVPIRSVRLASDLPPAARPAFEWLDTRTPNFAALLHARANRGDDFFIRPAGALDICNALPPVRRVAAR